MEHPLHARLCWIEELPNESESLEKNIWSSSSKNVDVFVFFEKNYRKSDLPDCLRESLPSLPVVLVRDVSSTFSMKKKHTQITFRKGHGHLVLNASRKFSNTSIQLSARNGPHGHCWKCPSNGCFPFLQRLTKRKKWEMIALTCMIWRYEALRHGWSLKRNPAWRDELVCAKFCAN